MIYKCVRQDYNENDFLITIMVTNVCNYNCDYCIEWETCINSKYA
jgi:MoaA/NifB/PqqE/SkfB family radical SAM enzyme